MRQLYAAEVTLVDCWLGRFLDRLANLGLADNTLVVLVSDHGVLLGEYGWVGKRYSEMHQELSHVPFVIRHPAGKAKGQHDAATSPPRTTSARRCCRCSASTSRACMNGADLSPLFDGRQPRQKRSYRTASYNTYVSARDDRWLLIADNRGEELRLYDRRHDRGERHNVAHTPPEAGAPALERDPARRRRPPAALPEHRPGGLGPPAGPTAGIEDHPTGRQLA